MTGLDVRPTTFVSGAIVPHAPVLLPPVSGDENAARTAVVRTAIAGLDLGDVEAIVLLSPHGSGTGVYRSTAGSLADFGMPGIRATHPTVDGIVSELSSAWGRPILEGPVDHGVLVPLLSLCPAAPVVAASLRETASVDRDGVQESVAEGHAFVDAVSHLSDRRLAFVASCNTGAGLSSRAPLTEVSRAIELEGRLVGEMERGTLSGDLAIEVGCAGSCAAGTLAGFAAAFGESQIKVRAHEAPFGVGYLVASALV
jgi:hypothetical protein